MQRDEHPEKQVCAWCGRQASDYKLTQKAVIRKKGGVPTKIESAEYAPACARHMLSLVDAEDPAVVRARGAARSKVWKGRQERLVD